MAAKKNTSTKSKTVKPKVKKLQKTDWISAYMTYVLEEEKRPKSVYKFAKNLGEEEADFYQFFGSLDALQRSIWEEFYQMSIDLMNQAEETSNFSNREKMLTFFFTFFELLTANRSYVTYSLREHNSALKNLEQLAGLRKHIKQFAGELIEDKNEGQKIKLLRHNKTIFTEGAWLQTVFLMKFWLDDNSPQFEQTDIAIEKSVNTIFDVFNNTPLERVIDFGKFIYQSQKV
ncbi:TetR family transcriptional regulator C-terminal domain-containing protein [Mesonia sp. HuA40]|uniref:TetR family transcriptional regulator C-terminal domain-containing protein n=1 Tax=Mesonia sp. HuA40 TaxID=2602761 RepID=UPI0011C731B2|nr:TetR family transcriptional regulator C-terminal domain-containing protein [Mesonia sp. HuA40]TXK74249.1 TetR/AcrR family transcriptional regulator [Mesonia sp. HuA40]